MTTRYESKGLEPCWRMGFGVVWMAAEVVQRMEEPWFECEWQPEDGVHRGEDYYFCEKAKALGYTPLVHQEMSKKVKHIGQFGFNPLLHHALDKPDATGEFTGTGKDALIEALRAENTELREMTRKPEGEEPENG